MNPETDLVIVSMHEKGFPTADFHAGCGAMHADEFNRLGRAPDAFFTMKRGDTIAAAFDKARERWPNALIVPAADEGTDEDE